ncbi:hypothetical protein ACIP5Y_30615 [Nocardia sp. NPDC088792]|uniref:hypothetical protein n=1 Tax=Nocardia sp. NPDC088792 TaxID=3364332 RepID=UPI00382CF435
MSPRSSSRSAAVARLAAIAATMAAVPVVAVTIGGTAGAATAPAEQSAVLGAAARAHLATLIDQGITLAPIAAADRIRPAATEPTPFHQFHQAGPFRQGFHQGFNQAVPFHQAPGNPFIQLVDP